MNNTFHWEHPEISETVKSILSSELHSGNRIRLFFGDKETGKDWCEEYDVIGYIGRSTGTQKIPLLVNNSRSFGGPAILTDCIVKITKNGYTLYEHPNYHIGSFEIAPADIDGYFESVYRDGEIVARFKKPGQAGKYVEFMLGKRNSK